ncbi:ABC transporter ATP-binding protein [Streptomyces triticirhizae]|uniref:ABC transporter ATP-binding protein n=1 Tax=Streptomyces triticirhizae TaxID=2483353 RepID=A0A3M2LX82_9ACTN|nr:ABC transporter ATP-binding protein [Streptomyces triticirhizae]RMI42041.1 ABC transporter ATP-binding protein [Streptomyces triticirhizae]
MAEQRAAEAGAAEEPADEPAKESAESGPPAWRVLLGYVRPYRWTLLLGALLSLLTGAAGLALPLVARSLIEELDGDGGIAGQLLWLTLLVLANAGLGALGYYILQRTAESVVLTARRSLTSYLLRLRISAVDASEPGDLLSRATSDTTLLRAMTTQSLIGLGTGGLTLVATLLMMGLVDVVLLGVTLGVVAAAGVVIGVIAPMIQRASKRAQESVGEMGASLERVLGALRTVKAAGAEEREERTVHEAAERSWRASVTSAKWSAVAGNTMYLAIQGVFLTVLAVGGARVATGSIEIGTLVAFLLYVFYLISPLQEVVSAITQYQVGSAAISRIREVWALPVEPTADGHRPALAAGGGEPAAVAFEDVRFRYAPDAPLVHHGVDFRVPARGMTAFVGPSGAGKTTVFSLIERFYDATEGRVLVDGRDVREWDLAQLRASIGYVEQDAPVLSGTLRDNLLFGAPDTAEDALAETLRTARLDTLVARLPEGLDTLVGHRGTKLSGGERQRVAIARALLRRPRLLLLDEATSQLDAVNEAALRDTVAEVARRTTVLVVAHRLSTVTSADRIVVMDAGRVRAVGTHRELVATNPLYAELAATQFLAEGGDPANGPSADEVSPDGPSPDGPSPEGPSANGRAVDVTAGPAS